ncbi:hypothetical protein NKH45_34360 [Mesorhizobium sp. M1156]|uniref:hypothetical protein n=1 Tax=Mesorhizobium sp. M1156 TaxID=2957064 RepID=UPI0033355851
MTANNLISVIIIISWRISFARSFAKAFLPRVILIASLMPEYMPYARAAIDVQEFNSGAIRATCWSVGIGSSTLGIIETVTAE